MVVMLAFTIPVLPARAQDAATGAIRGTVLDAAGARIAGAKVTAINTHTAVARTTRTDAQGEFWVQLLLPNEYEVHVSADGMRGERRTGLHVEVGGVLELEFRLAVAGPEPVVTVEGDAPLVETRPQGVSAVIDKRAIEELPLDGRRYTDLALLTPGAIQDPRGLTSATNGDLAFGGVRGFQSSFLVDGADNNNAFFAQARGRYRAPYQFSNEVVQEFRVSSNTYGADLGRAGGAVINVVTRSGSNQTHGSLFYFLRDSEFAARPPGLPAKPSDRRHQVGGTLGGRLIKNQVFYFVGFDQHVFRVPNVVLFADGSTEVAPTADDFEFNDQALVFAAADQLSALGGEFESSLIGHAAFAKVDVSLSPQHYLSGRLSASRYYGDNNVFFDPSSPARNFALSSNGEERVETLSAALSLTSALSFRATSHLRVQASWDNERSLANSDEPRTVIDDVLEGFGRSVILPRRTDENRVHIAETVSLDGRRHSFKFGGDFSNVEITNIFPLLFGGQYTFRSIRVNPFTFAPQTFGLQLTPLRAFAHEVPRFYSQNFGSAVSHPDTREYALFAQDTIRVSDRLALTLGVRWDLQTFRSDRLVSNPLWPDSGKAPTDTNNVAPRVGFALSFGEGRPWVIRGGYGIFYTRIPQIYNSAIETDNGLNNSHLLLDNADFFDRQIFPAYPNPLVECGVRALTCAAPASVTSRLTTEISSFAPDFQTPFVQQASLTVEREVARRFAIGAAYLYVHGQHLIRARDVNLPEPVELTYPVFEGTNFTGDFFSVDSFSTWQLAPSLTCPFPPCINEPVRPLAGVEAINVFESAASSVYHGLTLSARRRMTDGFYFRVAYTFGQAIDDNQDGLVAGPATVQNSFATRLERGRSVTDQRHRLAVSWIYEFKFFGADQPGLRAAFNDWRVSGVFTRGSGRPVNARIAGDANGDNNLENDRLPGFRRNAFTGPDYATMDVRLARRLFATRRVKLDLMVEAFNLFNRNNRRVDIGDDGFADTAANFVPLTTTAGGAIFPAFYQRLSSFLRPVRSYSPRQVQFALKAVF
ncbi:MAG TPA: TonB-dependent receptor [Terriglobales bacterium]|nr:TonB-dependent receptor [Terriglobales bacterium]